MADRVFCIYREQAPAKGRKAETKMLLGYSAMIGFYSYNRFDASLIAPLSSICRVDNMTIA